MTSVPVERQPPTLEEQARFYDDWNARYRATTFDLVEPESRARGEQVLKALALIGHNQRGAHDQPSILEVGCGTGWFAEKLAGIGKVTAIDLSEQAIEIARQRGLNVEFIAGDFNTIDLPAHAYDVAICMETITSIPDQPHFIARIASLVRPGGHLILTSVNTVVYRRRSDIGSALPGQVRRWLNRRELHQILRPAFRILHSRTFDPKGDMGFLRVVNSTKVNRLLERVFAPATITSAKENLGLGHCRIIVAERLAD